MAAGVAEPRHADARAERRVDAVADRLDPADDLVAGNDRQLRIGQFAVDDVQIGAADAAGLDAHADLAGARLGLGPFLDREPLAGPPVNHGAHGARLAQKGLGEIDNFRSAPRRSGRAAASPEPTGAGAHTGFRRSPRRAHRRRNTSSASGGLTVEARKDTPTGCRFWNGEDERRRSDQNDDRRDKSNARKNLLKLKRS